MPDDFQPQTINLLKKQPQIISRPVLGAQKNFSPIHQPKRASQKVKLALAILALFGLIGFRHQIYAWVGAPATAPAAINAAAAPAAVLGADTQTVISSPTTMPPPSPIQAAAQSASLLVSQTPTGYLNVRDQPSTVGNIVTQVHPGDTFPYSATQNGWYQITLPSGQTGWVDGQYTSLAGATQPAAPRGSNREETQQSSEGE